LDMNIAPPLKIILIFSLPQVKKRILQNMPIYYITSLCTKSNIGFLV